MADETDPPRLKREPERSPSGAAEDASDFGSEDILLPPETTEPPALLAEPTTSSGPPSSALRSHVSSPPPPLADRERDIGAPVHGELTRRFLAINPTEGFDIQTLNELRLEGVAPAGAYDPKLLAEVATRAEDLMVRVKSEVDDPLLAAPFLTEQVLAWFRESPSDPFWLSRTPRRWSGIFAASRTSGGTLAIWLNYRLDRVRTEAIRLSGVGRRLRHQISSGRRAEDALARQPLNQIQGEVAQAILDDLAFHPRGSSSTVPLVRLSELAVRRQVPTVNEALARLFSSSEAGPFVIVHPNRYPDCPELVVRPPMRGASGAALAYQLVAVERVDRLSSRGRARSSTAETPEELPEGSSYDPTDAAAIWERSDVDADAWREAIEGARQTRQRLEAPPKDFRGRPSYAALRIALLESAELRPHFLAVRWRGRPSGLALVVSLLSKGSLSPEVLTDHEYLDAELSDLARGDPDWKPENGEWEIPGWKVSREGDHRDGFRYRAETSRPRAEERSGRGKSTGRLVGKLSQPEE